MHNQNLNSSSPQPHNAMNVPPEVLEMILAGQDELTLVALAQTSRYMYQVVAPKLWGVMMPSLSYNHRFVLFEREAHTKLAMFHTQKGPNNFRDKLNRQMRSRDTVHPNGLVHNLVLTTPNFDQKFLDREKYPNVRNVELVVKGCGSMEVVRSLRIMDLYMRENPGVKVAIDAWCHVPISVEHIVQRVFSLDIYEFPEDQVCEQLKLKQLRLTNSDSTKPSLQYLSRLQGLEFLEVPGIAVSRVWLDDETDDNTPTHVALHFPNLTHLRIKCIRTIPVAFLNSIVAPRLTTLELYYHFTHTTSGTKEETRLISQIHPVASVTHLRLADISEPSDLAIVRRYPQCRMVTIVGKPKWSVASIAFNLMHEYLLDRLLWERVEGSVLQTTTFEAQQIEVNKSLHV
ncbi:hypothetical protein LXG23DRAFT_16076 [Yarrowia lipolytica]|uniref:F-box domain-containing protein n=1 Tax=Yarrowia lipolytica TaxID=4952 RepID=A0A1D8NJU3_YARLL|nr:hypothetical protein YALI1_E28808g [Yarrowia lipolytica]KAB8285904.1 hypothetical protein BKA91DRAFT_162687 [Yarrowia lipolytica]KAE8171791.1 hypothetical protein BKA90DRAFT_157690 [Yarrowia lipolytica]KAJ8057319.1 hypothetical protein LXG23DRAFT_16076 [Yarrowia lipolytica]RMI98551.1 hypothetical protein BD777DRAFT_140661 [Yarrowia lipolytica]